MDPQTCDGGSNSSSTSSAERIPQTTQQFDLRPPGHSLTTFDREKDCWRKHLKLHQRNSQFQTESHICAREAKKHNFYSQLYRLNIRRTEDKLSSVKFQLNQQKTQNICLSDLIVKNVFPLKLTKKPVKIQLVRISINVAQKH